MRKLALVLGMSVLAPMAMADRTVHQTLPLEANGRVTLGAHNGTVTVTTWNQPNVDINARIEQGTFGDASDVEKTKIDITGSGSSVRIETNYDAIMPSRWFGNRELPPVHYTISMPATAKLEVSVHNATVKATGLRNEVVVDSHNGPVNLADIDADTKVETHNGDVTIAFARFAKASRIETHNGSVEVSVPADSRFHVDASGHHLGLDSELGVAATKVSDSHYTGDVNGGGPELRFEAHNGSLKIRKR